MSAIQHLVSSMFFTLNCWTLQLNLLQEGEPMYHHQMRPIRDWRTLACGLAMACAAPVLAADGNWMSEDDMRTAFAGGTLEGKYGSGRPFSEAYRNDGSLEYREAAHVFSGRWSVQADTFCTIYDNDPSGGCYRVKKVGGNCYEFYFVARTEQQAHSEPKRPSWTARGSIVGKPGICAEQHNV